MPDRGGPLLDRFHAFGRLFFRPVFLARLFFVLLSTWCGMLLAEPNKEIYFFSVPVLERGLYSMLALIAALIITIAEHAADAISSHKLLMATIGLMVGLIFARLFYPTIPLEITDPATAQLVCNLLFGYFGAVLAIKHAERFHLSRLKFMLSQPHDRPKVLDTSVIIDGRIRVLIELQVVNGPILVPNFVLVELQTIADSNDSGRKARGRRGLDVLDSLREACKSLEVIDKDYPDRPEVDQKLVQLCREMDADLITNDYNLQKIAQMHRLTVINVNEIANGLRPTVYIGEIFSLMIVREGKEPGQGVGYLDDGTMVVVDDASHLLGQEIQVSVSSILQTSSGRLVFARHREDDAAHPHRARA